MKKLILLSFLLVATLIVNAQRGGGNPEASAQKQVDRLTEQLSLSADQQTQLYDLFIDRQQSRKAGGEKMRDLDEAERTAMKTERKAAKADFDSKVATILTPAQYETFQNLPKDKRGKGKGAGKGKKGGDKQNKGKRENATPEESAQKQTDRLTEKLGLDANQQAAVYDLMLDKAAKRNGIDRKSLSKEERTILKENNKKDKAAFDAELANILTPAQYETFQNLPKKKKGKKGKKSKKNKK